MARARRARRRWGRAGLFAAIGVYVLFALAADASAWLHGAAHTMGCGGCGDRGQEVWFLAWGEYALTHLLDPLRSTWINAPGGVDLADNTSMPLAGAMAAPITAIFGPVAAFNVVMSFAFASSATACLFMLRRFTGAWAAFVGGLLYGFSPFMIGQGIGHLFLLLGAVPPLLLLLLHEILLRQRLRWWVAGSLFALLELIQLGWSPEVFAEMGLLTAVGLVVVGLAGREKLPARLPYAAKALGLGLLPVLVVAAGVGLVARTGAEHLSGPVHPVGLLSGVSDDLFGPVVPTANQHFTFGYAATGDKWVALTPSTGPPKPDVTENGAFIGIPLLLLLVLGVWKYRRLDIVRFSALMAAFSFLMSMGSRLRVLGHDTGVPLPFAVLTRLPFLDSEEAARYAEFMWLFVAVIVAVVADRWLFSPVHPRRHGRSTLPQLTGRVLPGVLLALGIVTLVPAWPYQTMAISVPAWFNSAAERRVPEGSVLLAYPTGTYQHNETELWQSLDDLRYRISGGEAAARSQDYGVIGRYFNSCWSNGTVPLPSSYWIAAARGEVVQWDVRTVVIPFEEPHAACALRYMTRVLGAVPEDQEGAGVWTLPPHTASSPASS